MLTFFTTGKPFTGHPGVTQRNALHSWKLLHPDVEVILFGDEPGASEVAHELGLRHERELRRHPSGLPYISYMFDRAHDIAAHDVLCYINCDIILVSDFLDAQARLRELGKPFLMIGRRWDTDITEPVDYSNLNWQETVRNLAIAADHQREDTWIDYFVFRRDLYYKQVPDFLVSRCTWDHWLVWQAIQSGAYVVDASAVAMAVHQNHDYSYHPQGQHGAWTDELAQRNLALAGGSWRHQRRITDATARLTLQGFRSNPTRYWNAAKRSLLSVSEVVIFRAWHPVWHPILAATRPLRARFGLRSRANRQPNPS